MYILIHNSTGSFSIDLPEYFKQININSIYSIVEENDYLYKSNIEEFFLNKTSYFFSNLTIVKFWLIVYFENDFLVKIDGILFETSFYFDLNFIL